MYVDPNWARIGPELGPNSNGREWDPELIQNGPKIVPSEIPKSSKPHWNSLLFPTPEIPQGDPFPDNFVGPGLHYLQDFLEEFIS